MTIEYKPYPHGKSPFSHMNHKELCISAHKMYNALNDMSKIIFSIFGAEKTLYWSEDGRGGRILKKIELALQPITVGQHKSVDKSGIEFWNKLQYEVVLLFADRLYVALDSAVSILNSTDWYDHNSRTTFVKATIALQPVTNRYHNKDTYQYFRFADDLLFPESIQFDLALRWYACSKCGSGSAGRKESNHYGMSCAESCGGELQRVHGGGIAESSPHLKLALFPPLPLPDGQEQDGSKKFTVYVDTVASQTIKLEGDHKEVVREIYLRWHNASFTHRRPHMRLEDGLSIVRQVVEENIEDTWTACEIITQATKGLMNGVQTAVDITDELREKFG